MSAIYRRNVTVPTSAIDENGHLNNVTYVQWMQEVAIAHANHTTCTRETNAVGATWVIRSHRIDYLKPTFEGEQIAVFTWIANIRKVRSQRKYCFFRPADQTVLATGKTDWIFVNAQTGRPMSIPQTVADAFEVITEDINPKSLSIQ